MPVPLQVGAAAFEAQEKAAAGLARYQAELFAQDWVSAQLAGPYAGRPRGGAGAGVGGGGGRGSCLVP